MDKYRVFCPYCGAEMDAKIADLLEARYFYECPKCKARSPETVGAPQEETIKKAQTFARHE